MENLGFNLHVRFKKNLPNAKMPTQGTVGAAGYDLYAAQMTLDEANNCVVVDTGLSTAFAPHHVMLIFGRSGLAMKHGIIPANAVGVVDSDYRGPIKVILRSSFKTPMEIMELVQIGDRVAQAVFMPVSNATFFESEDLEASDRGVGGFGSTGS
jgi:dUTP pyrophosphatase